MSNVKEKQLAKRKEIGQKAAELMNEVGFENLTVRMICNAAGISAGTFYHYFKNKSELVTALFSFIDDYFEENVVDKLNHEDEIINIITFSKKFAEYVTQAGVERSNIINSMFPVYSNNGINEERKRILNSELLKIIVRGQKKGQITTSFEAEKLVNMIIVILRGYCFDWARREGTYDLVRNTVDLITIFVKSLKPNVELI